MGLWQASQELIKQPLNGLLLAVPLAVALELFHAGLFWSYSTAVIVAMKNKMDLAVQIAVGSSLQIALFVAPVLVLASMLMGHDQLLDLHFTPLEMITVLLAVGVLALVAQDGECHWMEGVMLLGVYVILALAFYHLPEQVAQQSPLALNDGAIQHQDRHNVFH